MAEEFERILAESTARGANIVPGCVLAAVDENGRQLYSKSSGYDSVAADAPPINPDGTFWIASCTKLIGTIAALQCVERGQIKLEDPIASILPELASPEIITPTGGGGGDMIGQPFTTAPATKKITLWHLLTHTSGLSYDFAPLLMAWRASRGETPIGLSGKVVEAHSLPLLFEPGEGWVYGGGIDWAGTLVGRLNGCTLEEYLQKHIFEPLGMKSTSFRFEKHPDIQQRMVKTSERTEDGSLKESKKLWPDYAEDDCAGAGLYASVGDYMQVMGDLIQVKPTLLKRETVDQMFTPQFAAESPSMKGLSGSSEIFGAMAGMTGDKGFNWGLGGLYIDDDTSVLKKDTLVWGGLPNLMWVMNREQGVAVMYASQVIPPGDPKTAGLIKEFMKEVWRIKSTLPT